MPVLTQSKRSSVRQLKASNSWPLGIRQGTGEMESVIACCRCIQQIARRNVSRGNYETTSRLKASGHTRCTSWNAARRRSGEGKRPRTHTDASVPKRKPEDFYLGRSQTTCQQLNWLGEGGPKAPEAKSVQEGGVRIEASYRRWIDCGQATRREKQRMRRWTCKRIEGGSCQGQMLSCGFASC